MTGIKNRLLMDLALDYFMIELEPLYCYCLMNSKGLNLERTVEQSPLLGQPP